MDRRRTPGRLDPVQAGSLRLAPATRLRAYRPAVDRLGGRPDLLGRTGVHAERRRHLDLRPRTSRRRGRREVAGFRRLCGVAGRRPERAFHALWVQIALGSLVSSPEIALRGCFGDDDGDLVPWNIT